MSIFRDSMFSGKNDH